MKLTLRHQHSTLPRIFLTCALVLGTGLGSLQAQPQRMHEQLIRAKPLNEREVVNYLHAMRSSTFAQSYVFRFQIKHYPYRARTFSYHGTLYGQIDPVSGVQRERILLQTRDPEKPRQSLTLQDLLLIRGAEPHAWVATPHQSAPMNAIDPTGAPDSKQESASTRTPPQLLTGALLEQPLLKGISLTPFDLLVPYFYWNRYEYRGPEQVKARPTQSFRLFNPHSDSKIDTVEVELDDEFRAILKASYLGADNKPLKSMELIAFKKTGDTYIPKTLDYRETVERGNKTRIDILAAAMDVELPPALFQADNVGAELPLIESYIYDVF